MKDLFYFTAVSGLIFNNMAIESYDLMGSVSKSFSGQILEIFRLLCLDHEVCLRAEQILRESLCLFGCIFVYLTCQDPSA